MANTYTQVNIHGVFAVKGRQNMLIKDIRHRVFEYIHGIIKGTGQFPLAVNGYLDHVHVFFELSPTMTIAKALQEIKSNSSLWINKNKLIKGKFQWQNGYGAFSYSRNQRDKVIKYIMNQEEHHKKETFKEEYINMLEGFSIDYNDQFLFEFYE
jgi:putative transposase